MPRTTLDARRLGLSVDARPPLRTSRKTRHTASGRSAGTEPPTTPGCFPHRARPDPRGFLLVRFSNVGRHRAGGRRHAAAHIEKPPTERPFAAVATWCRLNIGYAQRPAREHLRLCAAHHDGRPVKAAAGCAAVDEGEGEGAIEKGGSREGRKPAQKTTARYLPIS